MDLERKDMTGSVSARRWQADHERVGWLFLFPRGDTGRTTFAGEEGSGSAVLGGRMGGWLEE